jgi:hypothetical protein
LERRSGARRREAVRRGPTGGPYPRIIVFLVLPQQLRRALARRARPRPTELSAAISALARAAQRLLARASPLRRAACPCCGCTALALSTPAWWSGARRLRYELAAPRPPACGPRPSSSRAPRPPSPRDSLPTRRPRPSSPAPAPKLAALRSTGLSSPVLAPRPPACAQSMA